MFDVGFSEMIMIAVVALIVIGPEKLPKVARTLGLLAGRMQRYVSNVKSDIQREMQFEDLQRLQQEIKQGYEQTHTQIRGMGADINRDVAALEKEIESSLVVDNTIHASAANPTSGQQELPLSSSASPHLQKAEPSGTMMQNTKIQNTETADISPQDSTLPSADAAPVTEHEVPALLVAHPNKPA